MKDMAMIGNLARYLKPYLPKFIFAIVLDTLSVLLYTTEPLFYKEILRLLKIETTQFTSILAIGLFFIVAMFASIILMYISGMMVQKVGQRVIYDIRRDIFNHIEELAIGQLNTIPVGKLVTRITNDTGTLMDFFTNILVNMLKNIITLVAIAIISFFVNWQLALILIAFLPIILAITIFFRSKSKKVYREIRKNVSSINGFLSENLSGMKTIQIFNQEERKAEEFTKLNKQLRDSNLKSVRIFALFRPGVFFIYVMAIVAVMSVGLRLVMNGQLDTDGLYAFYIYISQFFNPVQNLAEQFNGLQSSMTAAERILAVLDLKADVLDSDDSIDVDGFKGKIEFKNVWFSYVPGEWVLKDISFVIEPGETAAFVGATGAGKSTIIGLIVRNYEIQKGQILIDGIDIKKIKINSLRKHIGEMLQDVFLFSGTIASNIALDDDSITRKEIEDASRYVGADTFIEKLPKKYDEEVLERGNNFSMGQRQLISFARTVVYKPNIVVLDEATANIDTETEVLIQNSLLKMKNIGTMVIVAHRLSTIKHADKIFVISKGKIIEEGTHQELLKLRGTYYNLYRLQNMQNSIEGK
ncbi:MAG TPA: ABC transporter ATP-binding protein [Firmicutes bacterium]|nr:ABC transporter ATP-binding protein [Bacillota bacterium]HAW99618.1 ABC transporter ATP-binding protein [Bacillota bacterium]